MKFNFIEENLQNRNSKYKSENETSILNQKEKSKFSKEAIADQGSTIKEDSKENNDLNNENKINTKLESSYSSLYINSIDQNLINFSKVNSNKRYDSSYQSNIIVQKQETESINKSPAKHISISAAIERDDINISENNKIQDANFKLNPNLLIKEASMDDQDGSNKIKINQNEIQMENNQLKKKKIILKKPNANKIFDKKVSYTIELIFFQTPPYTVNKYIWSFYFFLELNYYRASTWKMIFTITHTCC